MPQTRGAEWHLVGVVRGRKLICHNLNGILDTLCDKLWPGRCASTVTLLTKATVGLRANQDYSIKLW